MTGFEILHLANILTIWAFAICLMWVVGKIPHSFTKCILRIILYRDKDCIEWLKQHKYYTLCLALIWLLLYVSLTLLSQLNYGLVRIRSEYTVAASAVIWILLCPLIIHLFLKAYKHEIKQ